MAKTQAEWFSTLKSWVPEWFFLQSGANVAIMQGIAKVLEAAQIEVDTEIDQTFILRAVAPYLDLHGSERSTARISSEFDSQYRIRVRLKSLISQLSKPAIASLVNALLIKGIAHIREDWEGDIFVGRGEFTNRGAVVITPIDNTFTLLVDKQIRGPHSFIAREFFSDRESFVGNSESSDFVFELIRNAIDENKALGVFYRIIERLE